MYCPNCSAKLNNPPNPQTCWNCGAEFGPDADWSPTTHPTGSFRKARTQRSPKTQERWFPKFFLEKYIGQHSGRYALVIALITSGLYYAAAMLTYRWFHIGLHHGNSAALIIGGILSHVLVWPGMAIAELPDFKNTILRNLPSTANISEAANQQDAMMSAAALITTLLVFIVTWLVTFINQITLKANSGHRI